MAGEQAPSVDVNELLRGGQGITVQSAGQAHVSQMARQAIIADRKFDEVDVEQAVANRYSTTGKPNESTDSRG